MKERDFILTYAKVNPDVQTPRRAFPTDAGLDLYAYRAIKVNDGLYEYDTGLKFAIPVGYVGLVMPRSSVSNTGASLANSVGALDSDYRGTVLVRYYADRAPYVVGERVAQLVIVPIPSYRLELVEEMEPTPRGSGGFGSTGK